MKAQAPSRYGVMFSSARSSIGTLWYVYPSSSRGTGHLPMTWTMCNMEFAQCTSVSTDTSIDPKKREPRGGILVDGRIVLIGNINILILCFITIFVIKNA
jgi:hypothetical protein